MQLWVAEKIARTWGTRGWIIIFRGSIQSSIRRIRRPGRKECHNSRNPKLPAVISRQRYVGTLTQTPHKTHVLKLCHQFRFPSFQCCKLLEAVLGVRKSREAMRARLSIACCIIARRPLIEPIRVSHAGGVSCHDNHNHLVYYRDWNFCQACV